MTTPHRPPKDGIRAMPPGSLVEDGRTLFGRLARTGEWAEIKSQREGHFLERHASSAFKKTFTDRPPKILFNHGKDPGLGNRVIAEPLELGEDEEGPFYRAELLEGLDPLIVEGLRRGLYGSSHTFEVVREDWDPKPKNPGAHNPKGLPERTIREVKCWELGPVTWPAYAGATAQARSMSDEFLLGELADDPDHLRNLVTYMDQSAPSVDAGASPHLEPERRATRVQTTPTADTTERKPMTDQYVTRGEKSARIDELKQAITRQAEEYPGVMPAEAQASWDADNEEMDNLERDVRAWDARQARLEALSGDKGKVETPVEPSPFNVVRTRSEADIYDIDAIWSRSRGPEQRDQLLRDNAMRASDTASFAHPDADVDATRSKIARLLDHADSPNKELARRILTTGNPTYRRTFYKYLTGQPMTSEEQRAGALTVQVDATGGFSVPFYFDPTIVATGAHTTINPYRRACRVIPIVGTDTFHGVTAAAAVVARAAENAASSEGGPAIGQISAIVGKVHGMITLSVELLQDNPGIAAEMVSLIAEAKDTEEESIFTLGAGDALGGGFNPIGLIGAAHDTTGAYTHQDTAAAAGVLTAADLYALEAALPVRHRMNAQWFMNRSFIRICQGLETTGGALFGGVNYAGVGFINNDSAGNTGLRLLGYPVNEIPSGNVWADTDNLVIMALVDPSSYYIIERVGMTVETVPHLWAAAQMPTGQRGIYAWWRNTAKPANIDAGRRLAFLP